MALRDGEQPLTGLIQVDDAYLGGERPGMGGRGSPNNVPIVEAVSTNDESHPMAVKLSRIAGFTFEAIAAWARANLTPGSDARGDGLACFAGVIDTGFAHSYVVVGKRKPREMPQFIGVSSGLGNLKTVSSGAYKSFKFGKYASQHLGAFCYRFNRRAHPKTLMRDLFSHAATAAPTRERQIRGIAEVHDSLIR